MAIHTYVATMHSTSQCSVCFGGLHGCVSVNHTTGKALTDTRIRNLVPFTYWVVIIHWFIYA